MSAVEKVSIALSRDLLASVRRAVASGDYASTSEVVREALREWKASRRAGYAGASAANGLQLTAGLRLEIADLCRRFAVRRLALFGSAISSDFDPAVSDVDVAVTFQQAPDAATAGHYFELKRELERIFGRPVDLVELEAMPDSRLKRHIERSQVLLHVEDEAV